MNEGRNLVKDAVKDAAALREAAVAAAENELIERMTPKIRTLVEKTLRGAVKSEDTDRIRRGVVDNAPGESHTGFEEGKKEKGDQSMDDKEKMGSEELDMESLMSMFPALSEEPDADEHSACEGQGDASGQIPTLGEADVDPDAEPKMEAKKDDKEEEKMDEEIEISEEQIRSVYEGAMEVASLAEAQVTKGFGEQTTSGEIEDVIKDVDKGLADVKKGEHSWEKETPPGKQDFTVKEAIRRGLAENKMLRTKLVEAVALIGRLHNTLSEVNLFNAKVLHVNRILNKHGKLTKEQKMVVLESIDKAKTIDEVKMVSETIEGSFKAAGSLTESRNPRKPTANAQRARTSGAADQKVLRESVDRSDNDKAFDRMKQLAGLVK